MNTKRKPEDMNIGDIFYECQSGINLKCKVLTRPEYTNEVYSGIAKRHWKWVAENVYNGDKINYGLTEGFEHYGPRLYSEPQYVHFIDGECVFKFMGDPHNEHQ
jgi:hypothetical protein